jgi:hypothetical protein
MNQHDSIRDILETYLPFNFNDKSIITAIMNDCGFFLRNKNINEDLLKYFFLEFNLKNDQTLIEMYGGNLISSLWLIDVFPPNPQKFISETVFNSGKLTYIYNSKNKTLKITKNGSIRSPKNTKSGIPKTRKSRKTVKTKRSK